MKSLLLFFLLSPIVLHAQSGIEGYVTDTEDGKPLTGANVIVRVDFGLIPEPIRLEEVVITAREIDILDRPFSRDFIDRQEFKDLAPVTTAELLRDIPGVHPIPASLTLCIAEETERLTSSSVPAGNCMTTIAHAKA